MSQIPIDREEYESGVKGLMSASEPAVDEWTRHRIFEFAVREKDRDVIDWMLEHFEDDEEMAYVGLIHATENRDMKLLSVLLKRAGLPIVEDLIGIAAEKGDIELIDFLLDHGVEIRPYKTTLGAIAGNKVQALRYLLKRGALIIIDEWRDVDRVPFEINATAAYLWGVVWKDDPLPEGADPRINKMIPYYLSTEINIETSSLGERCRE